MVLGSRPAMVAFALAAFFLVAGCFGAGPNDETPGQSPSPSTPAGGLPPGCDAGRAAFTHTYDGVPLDVPTIAVGCLVRAQWGSGEPTIGLTSKGTVFLYPAMVDLPGGQRGQFTGMGIAKSTNAGATWTRLTSGAGPANYHPGTADPYMYVDPATDRVFMEDLIIPPFNCANLSFSDNEGTSWTQTLAGCAVWDHVSYGAGKPVGGTTQGYPNVVHRCAITLVATTLASEGTGCQKSLNGGMTWQPPTHPFLGGPPNGQPYAPGTCHGAAHHIYVDHRGWVWVPRAWCNIPYVALSKDEGATWTRHRVHADPIPWHDAGIGVDANGTAYYLWVAADELVYLSVSRDDGATWSPPRKVSPTLVTGAGMINLQPGGVGKIAISYLANLDGQSGTHAVMTNGYGVDGEAPVFHTAIANPLDTPVASGACNNGFCPGQADFLRNVIGPEGENWASIQDRTRLGFVRLYGAPSLWDEPDPNGPFK